MEHDGIEFYPTPDDLPTLRLLSGKHYVVFSVSAGLPERDVPKDLVRDLVHQAQACSLLPVFVGRNYIRHGRSEYRPADGDLMDLVDKLTVPGVARVVQGAAGVVCCHSAVNVLAWLLRKPQLLLYPSSVYERHIVKRDQWAFGADFSECRHALFDNPRVGRMAEEFFNELSEQKHIHVLMNVAISERTNKDMKTCPLVIDWQDSEATIRWLEMLVQAHPSELVLLWMDQAPHHTSGEVQEWLEEHGEAIKIVHFPAYTPEEDPQEPAWKPLKKEVSHHRWHHSFAELGKAIDEYYQKGKRHVVNFLENFGYYWKDGRIYPLPATT